MKTTMGQLISVLLERYEHQLHDHELAVIATQVALAELMNREHDEARTSQHKAA